MMRPVGGQGRESAEAKGRARGGHLSIAVDKESAVAIHPEGGNYHFDVVESDGRYQ